MFSVQFGLAKVNQNKRIKVKWNKSLLEQKSDRTKVKQNKSQLEQKSIRQKAVRTKVEQRSIVTIINYKKYEV